MACVHKLIRVLSVPIKVCSYCLEKSEHLYQGEYTLFIVCTWIKVLFLRITCFSLPKQSPGRALALLLASVLASASVLAK